MSVSYWGTVITKTIAGVCAFNIGINLMMDNEIKKDVLLADLMTEYEKLVQYIQLDFEYFVLKVFNRKNKIDAYVSVINRKIYHLNKIARNKDKLLYSSNLPENHEKKQKNWYCKKRQELENLKDVEFIEKNIDAINVKYYAVDPAIFQLEIDGSAVVRGVKTKGSLNVGRAKASSNVILGMIFISAFLSAFGLEADKTQFENQMIAFWHYCLKAVEDIGIVLWQTFRGMLNCRKIISQQLTEPYAGRIKVLKEYVNWRLENNKPDTEVYKELHSEEILELTPQQIEELKKGA